MLCGPSAAVHSQAADPAWNVSQIRGKYGTTLMAAQFDTLRQNLADCLVQIFEAAGFASAQDATKVSVVLGGFKLLMTGKSMF